VPTERSLAWVLGETFEIQTLTTSNEDSLADNVERGEILQLLVWMTMGWSLFI
jgi:hypothetical protein